MTEEAPAYRSSPPRIALVLPGGGARSAYQVGVLKAIAEKIGGDRLAAFTCSGGDSLMTADYMAGHGLTLPQLTQAQHDALRVQLPRTPAWERWGTRATVVRTARSSSVTPRRFAPTTPPPHATFFAPFSFPLGSASSFRAYVFIASRNWPKLSSTYKIGW